MMDGLSGGELERGYTSEQWAAHRAAVVEVVWGLQKSHLDRLRHGGELREAGAPPWEYVAAVRRYRMNLACARERRRAQGERFWDRSEDLYDRLVPDAVWALRQEGARLEQRREAARRLGEAVASEAEDRAAVRRLRGLA